MFATHNKTTGSPDAATENAPVKPPFFQPKLTINQPGDQYEQEADRMADRVMRMPANSLSFGEGRGEAFFKPSPLPISSLQCKCKDCEDDEKIHRKENSAQPAEAGSETASYINSLSSKGSPLPDSTKSFFEPRFGQDFSGVKIHNDSEAAKSSQAVNALAYTVGNNIVFNQNQFSPESDGGKRLLAHELTHVVQQNQNFNNPTSVANLSPNNILMRDVKTKSADLPRLTDAQLEQRSNEIFEQTAVKYLTRDGKPVTKGGIGSLKRDLTVGILQGVKDGKIITIVNGHDPRFSEFIKEVLQPGEIFIEALSFVPDHVRTGQPRRSGHVYVHSEQVLASEAKSMGITDARVATSNDGCNRMCISNLRENYPEVTHVNPQNPKPSPTRSPAMPAKKEDLPVKPELPARRPVKSELTIDKIKGASPEHQTTSEPPVTKRLTEEVGHQVEPVMEATPGYKPEAGAGIGGAVQVLQAMQFAGLQQAEIDKFEDRLAYLQPKIDDFFVNGYSVELILIVEVPDSIDVFCAAGTYCDQSQFIYFHALYINLVESVKPIAPHEPKPYPTMSAGPESFKPFTRQGGSIINENEIPFLHASHTNHHCKYAKQTFRPSQPIFPIRLASPPQIKPVKPKP